MPHQQENKTRDCKFHRERKMMEKLHQISIALNSAVDLKDILKLTCKAAVEICNVDHSAVVLFEKNLLTGKVIAEYPPQKKFVETEIQVKGIPLEEQLVYHQQIINISDLHTYQPLDDVQKTLIGLNIRSVLIVPVVLNGKVIASFSLDMFNRPRIFHPDEIEHLRKLANQVAVAIGKARYVKELSVINRIGHDLGSAAPMDFDTKKIMNLVRTHTGSLLDVTNFYIALYDEESSHYSFLYHVDQKDDLTGIPQEKLSRGLTDYVRRTKSAILVDSEKNHELMVQEEIELVGTPSLTWLGAPLIARNKVLGVMAVQNYQSENAYDEHDLTVLQTIASQTAIALDNAQLFERLREQHANQIEAVQQIGRSIAASVDQKDMFQGILESVLTTIGKANLGEIRLFNKDTGELEVIASLGVTIKEKYRKIPLGQGIVGWAAQHKKSVLVPDVHQDPRYLSIYDGTGSEIAVPLLKEKKLIGVLNIEHPATNALKQDHLALAEAIAGLAVVAIENAGVYKNLDQKIKYLEVANEHITSTQEYLNRTTIAADFVYRLNYLTGTLPARIGMAMEKLDPDAPRDAEIIRQLNIIAGHSEPLLLAAQKIRHGEHTRAPEYLAINELLDQAVKKAIPTMPVVFVVMPFAEKYKAMYEHVIKKVVENEGLLCIRADDIFETGRIIDDIKCSIRQAHFIIADLSGRSPNVFYEVGMAHGMGKSVLLLTQDLEDVPPKLRDVRYFSYQDSLAGGNILAGLLHKALQAIEQKDEPDVPLFTPRRFEIDPQSCVVLMSITEEKKALYNDIVKVAANSLGFACISEQGIFSTRNMMEEIWAELNRARLVIADLSHKDPDVFYLTGICHGLGKEVIMMARKPEDIPFDLLGPSHVIYSDQTFADGLKTREKLTAVIEQVIKKGLANH